LFQARQDAAQVPGIKAQFAAQPGGRHLVTLPKLKQDASIGERVRAVQEALAQNADLPGEKAIELPDSANPFFGEFSHHTLLSFA